MDVALRNKSGVLRLILLACTCSLLTGCFSARSSLWEDRYLEYTVKKGDNLSAIGDRFKISSDELAEINDIDDPRRIQIGLVLKIPFVEGTQSGSPTFKEKKRRPAPQSDDASTRASLGKVNISQVAKYRGTLILPVEGARRTSEFGYRWLKFHEGLDLAAPEGTRVLAAHDGNVVYVSESFGGYGKIVVLKGERFLTVYAHNRKNRVSVGDSVSQGEWIADVGQTGDATGSHLHFETRVRDASGRYAAVDPRTFIKD